VSVYIYRRGKAERLARAFLGACRLWASLWGVIDKDDLLVDCSWIFGFPVGLNYVTSS
jgi:hypothetical protein